MKRYNKAIGAIVGGVVGLVLVATGLSDTGVTPAEYQPFIDQATVALTGLLGTFFSPKNAE